MMNDNNTNLILASNSPRRRQLLALLGMAFKVVPADVDETPFPEEPAVDYVLRLAAEKATWVRDNIEPNAFIIAADTTVTYNGKIFGKPCNEAEASDMLKQLRGRVHQVYSGIAVVINSNLSTVSVGTDVPMRRYSDDEIQRYIDTGDPLDKAGAYAIQHSDFHPVEELRGCYANVMGLPLCHLTKVMMAHNLTLDGKTSDACQNYIGYQCPVFSKILDGPDFKIGNGQSDQARRTV